MSNRLTTEKRIRGQDGRSPGQAMREFAMAEPIIKNRWDSLGDKLRKEGKLSEKEILDLLALERVVGFYDITGNHPKGNIPLAPAGGGITRTEDGFTVEINLDPVTSWHLEHGKRPKHITFKFTDKEILKRAEEMRKEFMQLPQRARKKMDELLRGLDEKGELGKADWIELLALERVMESPPGVWTLGVIPFPQNATNMVETGGGKAKITLRSRSGGISFTRNEVLAEARAILAAAPEKIDASGDLFGILQARAIGEGMAAYREKLAEEHRQLVNATAARAPTKKDLIRQFAIEELFAMRTSGIRLKESGGGYTYETSGNVVCEVSVKEIEERANQLRLEL